MRTAEEQAIQKEGCAAGWPQLLTKEVSLPQPCDQKAKREQEGKDGSHGKAETTAKVQAAHSVPRSFIRHQVL